MKSIGYIAVPLDLMLGNSHFIYLLSSAQDEWFVFDVCQAARIVMWIFVALFWIRSNKSENFTVGWYGLCAFWDLWQTINDSNTGNPTTEIVVYIFGAFIIQLYFKLNGSENHKGTVRNKK